MKVNVLGTEYNLIESNEANDERLKGKDGYCDTSTKECVVDEMQVTEPGMKKNLPEYKKAVIRHELIHAFLYESGLDICSWAENEELVDWIAIQFPKMLKAFMEAGCVDVPKDVAFMQISPLIPPLYSPVLPLENLNEVAKNMKKGGAKC